MAVEIERRFLVVGEAWRAEAATCIRLRDGLVTSAGGRKLRVRIAGEQATLTLKGPRRGFRRSEFEYQIPLADAEQMLVEFCGLPGQIIEKTRHLIPAGDLTWEVDVFHGLLVGFVSAEIELSHPSATFPRPEWLGLEITGNSRFATRRMVSDRLGTRWHTGILSRLRVAGAGARAPR